jgi:PAS domain S-box-containing protein
VNELALGLQLASVAGATWWLNRNRDASPIALWARGWLFLFASAAILFLGEREPWTETAIHLLGPFFPALLLAGALVFAGRRVPRWLIPLAFLLGNTRWGLDQLGLDYFDHWVALVFEPVSALAATLLALVVARRDTALRSRYLLVPAFFGIAVLEATSAGSGMRGSSLSAPELIGWAVVGPLTVAVQISVARDWVRGRHREVKRALGESEERFRALTENAFDLVAEMDRYGRFTYVNPRYEEWVGRSREMLTGTRALDLVHPEDRERTLAWFRARSAPGAVEQLLTVRARRWDGDWRWVESSGGAYRAAGELRIVTNSRDVTKRMQMEATLRRTHEELEARVKERTAQLDVAIASMRAEVAERGRIEQELRVSEERWRNVSALSSDLSYSILVEPDGSLQREWITRAVSRITGYSVEELDERGWVSILDPEDVDRVVPNATRVPEGETREIECRILTRSGETRWLRLTVTGARSPLDGKLRVLGAIRDVTEAHRAEQERRSMEVHMLEAQKLESLGVLAGGIAHDFNNLLAVILGNEALALGEVEVGSRLAGQLERIRSAAEHAKALTSQMLTYSGKAAISLKPLDLSGLIEEMGELLEASTSKKCRLETFLQHGRTLVEGDPTQLRQVVINLVTNASEALRDRPGCVTLRTGQLAASDDYLAGCLGGADLPAGSYVYLEVSDTGEGMDEEVRKRLFEPFFSTKFTGRGLGLASVLGIVRSHRGAIKLSTQPGEGSTFRVVLPASVSAAKPAPSKGHRRDRVARGARVLVVDDEVWVLELAREFLLRSGFDVVTADSGHKALEIVRGDSESSIDAVVLDLTMPDLDGHETFLELRALRPDLPVIVASGYRAEATADRFPADEIAAFVSKPYEPEELSDAILASLTD